MSVFFERLDHGVTVIDTGFVRPMFDASFLLIQDGRAAFIETGPNDAVPRLLSALQAHGLSVHDVDYVIPTHVHLDHAGGAGRLLQQLPHARMIIHPRGARHMIDPTALMDGVRAVYGAEIAARDYGELVPVPAERLLTTRDDMVIELGGRPLRFVHTEGHARHHFCIWDEESRGWFTGDTFGLAYPELMTPQGRYVVPATAPVQFDPEALHASVERLLAAEPRCAYLTHYGVVGDLQRHAAQHLRQVDAMVAAARTMPRTPQRHEQLRQACREIYLAELHDMGSPLADDALDEVLAMDIELNAQGLGIWIDKAAA